MSRSGSFEARFVEFIPSQLQAGLLYISEKYSTASHLCACGCGSKVVTPLKPGGWRVIRQGDAVSLTPSIGSWSLPCKSHYWIRNNRVEWAPAWSEAEIVAGRMRDQKAREEGFDAVPAMSWWRKLLRYLFGG